MILKGSMDLGKFSSEYQKVSYKIPLILKNTFSSTGMIVMDHIMTVIGIPNLILIVPGMEIVTAILALLPNKPAVHAEEEVYSLMS